MGKNKKADVYFIDFHAFQNKGILDKITILLEQLNLKSRLGKNSLVGIKTHFGEFGNTAYIRPVFFIPVIEHLKKLGAKPFLTDTNTLYVGMRSNSVDHLKDATLNGFTYSSLGVPVIIADGLRSKNEHKLDVSLKHFKTVYLAEDILSADYMIIISHFKGHELTGFGGALKNVGMGCATRRGKLEMHSSINPSVSKKNCIGCRRCVDWCPSSAIIIQDDKKAFIESVRCIGCGECIIVCPQKAIRINWNETSPVFQEKMVEYVYGYHKEMKGKTVYINFVNEVSPGCDCFHINEPPVVQDIGVLASFDPVAIDKASLDLINSVPGLKGSKCDGLPPASDKFKKITNDVDHNIQLNYASELEIGNLNYNLIKVDKI